MKYKETQDPLEDLNEAPKTEEPKKECPIKSEKKALVKAYVKIIKDRIDLIKDSIYTLENMIGKFDECDKDDDKGETES